MRWTIIIRASVATALLCTPAAGQSVSDRRVVPTEDGFLEIDTQTGNVTECRRTPEGYRCGPAKNDQGGLQAEIDRLRRENAELRGQLTQQRMRPQQPSDQEIDRALGVMERFLRRFIGIMREPDRT